MSPIFFQVIFRNTTTLDPQTKLAVVDLYELFDQRPPVFTFCVSRI